ncbi:uncharacterized protein [Temnothorax nylanderi]|uniref:uncharacterized protein isoform X1 n=2 Tax=Temnothorax nylanderi TaxID=102681 RepID=UPI003A88393C
MIRIIISTNMQVFGSNYSELAIELSCRQGNRRRESGSKASRDRGIPMVVLRYSPDSVQKWRTTVSGNGDSCRASFRATPAGRCVSGTRLCPSQLLINNESRVRYVKDKVVDRRINMESHERCARCRAKSIVRKSDDPRKRCRSEHASEKGTTFSPRRHTPECLKFHMTSEEDERKNEITSCVDKFALAKRLHAENLQHQPLPDRVDDSVFRKGCRVCSPSCERDAKWNPNRANPTATRMENRLFGAALGCKKPETRMDLAICWETPRDPVYEPRRPTHIDGSEGGTAPAIFAMIQHTPVPKNRELLSCSGEKDKCSCARRDQAETDSRRNQCCCDRSCNELRGERRCEKPSRSNSVPRVTERKCAACRDGETETEFERRRRDPRLIRSAVGAALGLEEKRWSTTGDDVALRNGLPPMRMTVPRPRTPFARRAFCIDTLAPPFSVVSGCRDADYPEHWRLMSVYQQSYRNPQKRKIRRF